jgi:hypothetical protein
MVTRFEARSAADQTAILDVMGTEQAAQPSARHMSRPGRRVLVAARLSDLTGPVHGSVELPIWLFWYPDRAFDLDAPGMLPWMYQVVLREASSAEDLAYLNGGTLIALWPDLHLPKGVRRAWEDIHPELRSASVPAA